MTIKTEVSRNMREFLYGVWKIQGPVLKISVYRTRIFPENGVSVHHAST